MAKTLQSSTSVITTPDSYAALKRYVVDYVQGGDDPELLDIAGRAINQAIDELNAETWKKVLARQTITTQLSVSEYRINNDFKDPRNLSLLDLTYYPIERLGYKEMKTLEVENPRANEAGRPSCYSVDYSTLQLVLERAPTQEWVSSYPYMSFLYMKRFSYLTQDSDRHGGPPEFNGYLRWAGRADLAATRGETGLANKAEAKAARVMKALKRSDGNTLTDWVVSEEEARY